jgi:DNA-binding ferritin-like protein
MHHQHHHFTTPSVTPSLAPVYRYRLAQELTRRLADLHILHSKTLYCHAQVAAGGLTALAAMLEVQYDALQAWLIRLGGHIHLLRFNVLAPVEPALEVHTPADSLPRSWNCQTMLLNLMADYERMVADICRSFGEIESDADDTTLHLLVELATSCERAVLLLRHQLPAVGQVQVVRVPAAAPADEAGFDTPAHEFQNTLMAYAEERLEALARAPAEEADDGNDSFDELPAPHPEAEGWPGDDGDDAPRYLEPRGPLASVN